MANWIGEGHMLLCLTHFLILLSRDSDRSLLQQFILIFNFFYRSHLMKCTPERRISILFPFRNEFILSWWWLGVVWRYQAWKQWGLQLIRKLGARRTTFLSLPPPPPNTLNAASFEGRKFFKLPFVFMTQQRRAQWFYAYVSLPLAFALCWPSTWVFHQAWRICREVNRLPHYCIRSPICKVFCPYAWFSLSSFYPIPITCPIAKTLVPFIN